MAINAPIILPDPVGNYLETFKTFDTSARDRERIAMEQDRLVQAKIQQMRLNKADDFNLMMDTLNRQDKLKQEGVSNDFKERELGLLTKYRQQELVSRNYGNLTARYNALNPRGKLGGGSNYDPYNVLGRNGKTPTGAPADLSLPGDIPASQNGSFGFELPDANGGTNTPLVEPALPSGGSNPEASTDLIPSGEGNTLPPIEPTDKTPTTNPPNLELPPAETPTAPYTVQGNVGSSSAALPPLSPQTPAPAAGQYTLTGTLGGSFATPPPISQTAPAPASAPAPAPAAGPYRMESSSFGNTFAPAPQSALPPTTPYQAPSLPGAQPPLAAPPPSPELPPLPETSLAQAPIDKKTNDTLLALQKQAAALKVQGATAKADATMGRQIFARVAVENPAALEGTLKVVTQKEQAAEDIASKEADARNNIAEAQRQQAIVVARQKTLRSISGNLDKILPEADKKTLVEQLSDPSSGADTVLEALQVYNKIRISNPKDYSPTDKSNGIETATRVAQEGIRLSTPEAAKEERAANTYAVMKAEEEKLTVGRTTPLDANESKQLAEIQKQKLSVLADKLAWDDRKASFKQAIEKDKWRDPKMAAPATTTTTPLPETKQPPPMSLQQRNEQNSGIAKQWTTFKETELKQALSVIPDTDKDMALRSIQLNERNALAEELLAKKSPYVEEALVQQNILMGNVGGAYNTGNKMAVFKKIKAPNGEMMDAFDVLRLAAGYGPTAGQTTNAKEPSAEAKTLTKNWEK